MSCVLRIGGADLDADGLVAECGLSAYRISRKGEPSRLRSRGPNVASTIHVEVSSADFEELEEQVRDAIAFLDEHEAALRRARSFPGVEYAVLDFGVDLRDVAINCKRFPAALLLRAGALGVDIEVSLYPQPSGPANVSD
jgi:hypothetical protein